MTGLLQRRAREVRQRRAVLAWEYRQRRHSKGVWFRLRRALVDAESAWAVSDADAEALCMEAFAALSVGRALSPPKRIFFVPSARLAQLPSRQRVPMRLGAELLGTPNLVLVRHGE